MSLNRRRFISITAGCALASQLPLGTAAAEAEMGARWKGIALGAQADLRIVGLPESDAQDLLDMARAEIERLEQEFSLYRTGSALSRLNRDGVLEMPSPDMLEICSVTASIHAATDGAFDPTIEPLWAVYAESRGRPAERSRRDALAKVGWADVDYTPEHIVLRPGGALTFNGIAQGFVTDKVAQLLEANGLEAGLISVGEIAAVGMPAGRRGWPVQLAQPHNGMLLETLEMSDRAIATSSPTGTLFGDDALLGHIIDPRSGKPAESYWKQVSVIHPSAAVADALSTAAILLSSQELSVVVPRLSGAEIIAVNGQGQQVLI